MAAPLTWAQFVPLLNGLKATYTREGFIATEESANIWYRHLMDIPYEALSLAASAYMMTGKKEPTIADLREKAQQYMPKEKELGEQEAWALVRKAVRNSSYHSEEEFSKLPEVIQKAVGTPLNLAEWARMDLDDFETVQQSQFLRSFRVARDRRKEVQLLSPALQKKILALQAEKAKAIEKKGESGD